MHRESNCIHEWSAEDWYQLLTISTIVSGTEDLCISSLTPRMSLMRLNVQRRARSTNPCKAYRASERCVAQKRYPYLKEHMAA